MSKTTERLIRATCLAVLLALGILAIHTLHSASERRERERAGAQRELDAMIRSIDPRYH